MRFRLDRRYNDSRITNALAKKIIMPVLFCISLSPKYALDTDELNSEWVKSVKGKRKFFVFARTSFAAENTSFHQRVTGLDI